MMSQQYAQAQPTQIQHPPAPQPSTLDRYICECLC